MKTNKTWFYAIFLFILGIPFSNKATAQDTYTISPDAENWVCGLDSAQLEALASDTGFIGRMGRYNYYMNNPPGGGSPASGAPFIVPVVFHVISTSSATAVLPYAQIQWQMARLNAAFQNQMNLFNGQPLGTRSVNTQIEFRLACVAQNSNSAFTNANEPGVMRYASSNPNVLTQGVAPSPATTVPMLAITHPSAFPATFPFANYLNIWCVPSLPTSAGGIVNAYGTFPWMSAGIDGIVTRIDIVGNNSYQTNFNMSSYADKGSILAHEVGHYLGLYHTFQPQTLGCTTSPNFSGPFACYGTTALSAACEGDLVLDTPPTTIHNDLGSMFSVNTCHETNFPYGGPVADQYDQLENYMSYSDDDKLNTFTAGQTARMQSTFTMTTPGNRFNLNNPTNLIGTGVSANTCSVVSNILTGIFNYSLAPGSNCNSVFVQFINPLSLGFNTVGTTYSWNFGNGTGTGSNPLHTYSTSGGTLYVVTCTATNGTATATYSQSISVGITSKITGQTGPNVCRGSEQTIYIAFGQNVPSVQLTDGVNTPITVFNSMGTLAHTQPYTFPINASATYSIFPVGCNTTTATFNVTDCCNTLVTNGDFEAGISGYFTQLVTPFVTSPYPYYGSHEVFNPAGPGSLTPGIHNATGNAMIIDGFCGQPPTLTYSILTGCNAAAIPATVTPRPVVWRQTLSGLTAGLNYYYSFKISEQFNSHSLACILNFATSIYNTTLTAMPTQTLEPLAFAGSSGNPNWYYDFVVYTYTFTAPAGTTPATTFSIEINQINNYQGFGWDYQIDNILLQQMTPSIQAIGSKTICPAQTATLNALASCSTSTANFTYVWSPSAGLTNPNIINPVASPGATTIYTLVASPTATGIPASITTVTVTVRPTFTVTPLSQFVYAGNSATITATGSTGTYSWMPGAMTTSVVVVTPSVTTVYTVTNVMSGTCSISSPTVIVSTACSQTATAAFGNTVTNTNFAGGTYTTSGTVYDMQGSITFTSNASFTGYTFRMAPGSSLRVDPNVTLTLDNCKLFGCSELWQGILLKMLAPTPGGSIDIKNGTTIEDMYLGIYRAGSPGGTEVGQGFISIVNSKLNKNYIGVQLRNLPSYTAGTSYSLTVKNSTITTAASATSPGDYLKPSSSPSYTYAYNTISGGSGGGTAAYVNFPRSYTGISLFNLSTINNVVIGDSAGASNTFNTFSNLDFGIVSTNAQLRVHNNYFFNLKGSPKYVYLDPFNPVTVNGPDEIGVAIVASHTVANTYSLQVGTKNTTPVTAGLAYPKGNAFKTINKGVFAKNCNLVIAKGDYFDGDTTDVPGTDFTLPAPGSNTYAYLKAQSAIWITAVGKGGSLNYNFIKNYRVGVNASITLSVTSGSYLQVKNNNIQVPATVTGYCRNAISLDQVGGSNMPASAMEVSANSISKVYGGITAKSILNGLYVHDNTSFTIDNVKTLGKGINPANYNHLGIYLQGVTNGRVEKNTVSSTGTITASNYSLTNAYYLVTSASNSVTCNTANNVGRGFYFQANCASSQGWIGNSIINSYTGLELRSNGVIGIQGAASSTLAANTWSNVTQETNVISTTNANTASKMYVQANGTYTTAPSLNYGTAGQTYSVGPLYGIEVPASGTPFDCSSGGCGGCRTNSSGDSLATAITEALYAELASANDSIFPEYADEMMYQNQQLVYKLQDQGLLSIAGNNELQSFYAANQTSNIGKFTDVQTAIANEDISQAISINNSIASTNAVEQKTQRTNELMLKLNLDCNYQFTPSELQDLQSMAKECAVKGWYVAQSRSIISSVSGILTEYTDDCEGTEQHSRFTIATTVIEPQRSFNLFPNPNNGSMTMAYDLGKDKGADLNLYDVTGKLVSVYRLENTVGKIEMNEGSLHNGIYFYRILVNGKIIHTNKLVIIK